MVATPVDYRLARTGPTERKVLDALADERWVFRSPRGIARQTGLSVEEVQNVLDGSEHVKMFDIPNRTGGVLYALRHPGRLRKLKQYQQIFLLYMAREPLPSTH